MPKTASSNRHATPIKRTGDISLGSGETWTSTPYRDYADAHIKEELHRAERSRLQKRAKRTITLIQLVEKFDGICQICLKPVEIPTRDHILAIADGGTSHISNIQLACLPCNSSKGSDWDKFKYKRQGI